MSEKVLVIGNYYSKGLHSFNWWQDLPNISDYDTIILDTAAIFLFWSWDGRLKHLGKNKYLLSNNQYDEKIRFNLNSVRRKLLEILEFDVAVYALYVPNTVISLRTPVRTAPQDQHIEEHLSINTNDWCPISVETVEEKGETIQIKDSSYKEYFRDFRSWDYYFSPDSLNIEVFESYYHDKWKVSPVLRVIAENKVAKPLAIEFIPLFHRWKDDRKDDWHSDPEKTGGRLALLPILANYRTDSLIESLLKRSKVTEETPLPSWVYAIDIPGEGSLKREIAAQKNQQEAIASRIRELQISLAEVQKHKDLLFETGPTLQELVKSTLEELGAKLEPSIVADSLINVGGHKVLIEIKDSTTSITKDDVAQLVADLMEYLKTTGQEIDGMLIGNGWRLLPLEERDVKDKPTFSRDAISVAQNHNIGLISTTQLFEAYCKTLEDPQHTEDILNRIIKGKGIINF